MEITVKARELGEWTGYRLRSGFTITGAIVRRGMVFVQTVSSADSGATPDETTIDADADVTVIGPEPVAATPTRAPHTHYVIMAGGPSSEALLTALKGVGGRGVYGFPTGFGSEVRLELTDRHLNALAVRSDVADPWYDATDCSLWVHGIDYPVEKIEAGVSDPRPTDSAPAAVMHSAGLRKLTRLAEGLAVLAAAMDNPADLLHLARQAEATLAAYAADHADLCLGCLPVPVERQNGPQGPLNGMSLVTPTMAAVVDNLTGGQQ